MVSDRCEVEEMLEAKPSRIRWKQGVEFDIRGRWKRGVQSLINVPWNSCLPGTWEYYLIWKESLWKAWDRNELLTVPNDPGSVCLLCWALNVTLHPHYSFFFFLLLFGSQFTIYWSRPGHKYIYMCDTELCTSTKNVLCYYSSWSSGQDFASRTKSHMLPS